MPRIASEFTQSVYLWIIFGVLILPNLSCALYNPTQNSTSKRAPSTVCNIPGDQTGSISGHWPIAPIPVSFHQGDFDPKTEIPELVAAIDTWNNFFSTSKKLTIVNAGTADAPKVTSGSNPNAGGTMCGQSVIQSNQFSGVVGVYKLTRWPDSYARSAMAITVFCTSPQKPYSRFFNAVMEVNYQEFFVAGKKLPDLQSIFLHEIGHLIGLDHSCSTTSKAGFPNCSDPGLNSDYGILAAVMFPNFGFDPDTGRGQEKRGLGINDEERANCLYKEAQ